jgi:hypothetical protein
MQRFKYTVTNEEGDVYFRANLKSDCTSYIDYWQSATGHDKSSSKLKIVETPAPVSEGITVALDAYSEAQWLNKNGVSK